MKRSPLKRGKPLRRTPFRPKQRKAGIPPEVNDEVEERSQGRCEARIEHDCMGRATQKHHIRRQSQGGKHEASNLLHVCTRAHMTIHANPLAAAAVGDLALREHAA